MLLPQDLPYSQNQPPPLQTNRKPYWLLAVVLLAILVGAVIIFSNNISKKDKPIQIFKAASAIVPLVGVKPEGGATSQPIASITLIQAKVLEISKDNLMVEASSNQILTIPLNKLSKASVSKVLKIGDVVKLTLTRDSQNNITEGEILTNQ